MCEVGGTGRDRHKQNISVTTESQYDDDYGYSNQRQSMIYYFMYTGNKYTVHNNNIIQEILMSWMCNIDSLLL